MHLVEGRDVHWFSRQGHEHGGKSGYEVLDGMVRRQCTIDNLVLDGELIVWRPAKYVSIECFSVTTLQVDTLGKFWMAWCCGSAPLTTWCWTGS